jgi:hypothetical protein
VDQRGRDFDEFHAGCRCECLARQVVRRGTQAAGRDNDIGAVDRRAKYGHVSFEVIAHCGMECDRNAQLIQPLTEPLAVRVEPLAAGELVADRNDFSSHGAGSVVRGPLQRVRPGWRDGNSMIRIRGIIPERNSNRPAGLKLV